MKIKFLFFATLVLILLGAGCAGGPQATIESPSLGKADAPVRIVEYFDFQCPACKAAEESVLPFIIEDYVNKGFAAVTFKNMAFLGQESKIAAVAGLCAAEQNKFWEYSQKIYAAQGAENSGIFKESKLKSIAEETGLDGASFDACLDSQKFREQVSKETNDAFAAGINSTPTFVINGQKVLGGTYLSIKRVIDKKLEEIRK